MEIQFNGETEELINEFKKITEKYLFEPWEVNNIKKWECSLENIFGKRIKIEIINSFKEDTIFLYIKFRRDI